MAPVLNEPLGSLTGHLFQPWAPLAKGPVPEAYILFPRAQLPPWPSPNPVRTGPSGPRDLFQASIPAAGVCVGREETEGRSHPPLQMLPRAAGAPVPPVGRASACAGLRARSAGPPPTPAPTGPCPGSTWLRGNHAGLACPLRREGAAVSPGSLGTCSQDGPGHV